MHPAKGHDLSFTLPTKVPGQVRGRYQVPWTGPHAFEVAFIGDYTIY